MVTQDAVVFSCFDGLVDDDEFGALVARCEERVDRLECRCWHPVEVGVHHVRRVPFSQVEEEYGALGCYLAGQLEDGLVGS